MDLSTHNRLWSDRMRTWCRYVPGGWWGRGSILSPEMRGMYESYLPFEEFRHDLESIGMGTLPSPHWVPLALRPGVILSMPDFWAMLPDDFSGKVCFSEAELMPLFCALADPPRFGTASGRYPRQTAAIRKIAAESAPLRILDLGCGVGLGTLEILQQLTDDGHPAAQATGVTAEPLEAWMATRRSLPHDPVRSRQFRQFSTELPVTFLAGNAETYRDSQQYDLILCNGLAGGRFLNQPHQLKPFLASCRRQLAPGGKVLLAHRFHEGERPGIQLLQTLAAEAGWSLSGTWNDLELSMPSESL